MFPVEPGRTHKRLSGDGLWAAPLQKMLEDLYRVPMTVEQFRGRWLGLEPLDLEGFRSRLPGTPRLAALGELLRLYAGPPYDMHVRLIPADCADAACIVSDGIPVA